MSNRIYSRIMDQEVNPGPGVKYYAGASDNFGEPMPRKRSQHASHVRMAFMGLGALSLLAGAGLTGLCLNAQHQNNLAVHEVNILAQQISAYHPDIEAELVQAQQLADEIGNQVDPEAANRFTVLRTTAQNILNVQPPSPIIGDKPKQVEIDREIVQGIIAAHTNLVADIKAGETKLTEAHEAYLLNLAKAPAVAAGEALADPIAAGEDAMAASADVVSESARENLQAAIDAAKDVAERTTHNYKTSAEYDQVATEARQVKSRLELATATVISMIPVPEPEGTVGPDGTVVAPAPSDGKRITAKKESTEKKDPEVATTGKKATKTTKSTTVAKTTAKKTTAKSTAKKTTEKKSTAKKTEAPKVAKTSTEKAKTSTEKAKTTTDKAKTEKAKTTTDKAKTEKAKTTTDKAKTTTSKTKTEKAKSDTTKSDTTKTTKKAKKSDS